MNLSDRMKEYENNFKFKLVKKLPVIIRLDGKTFKTYTRGFERPLDLQFRKCMKDTALELLKTMQNCKIAYTQSDEISLLLLDTDFVNTEPAFGNSLNKLVSISASMCTAIFNDKIKKVKDIEKLAFFDSRAFNLPEREVSNYFLYRHSDAVRNEYNSFARSMYSHKELTNKKLEEIKRLVHEKYIPEDLDFGKLMVKKEEDKGVDTLSMPADYFNSNLLLSDIIQDVVSNVKH